MCAYVTCVASVNKITCVRILCVCHVDVQWCGCGADADVFFQNACGCGCVFQNACGCGRMRMCFFKMLADADGCGCKNCSPCPPLLIRLETERFAATNPYRYIICFHLPLNTFANSMQYCCRLNITLPNQNMGNAMVKAAMSRSQHLQTKKMLTYILAIQPILI
jgi:hypothetical protein